MARGAGGGAGLAHQLFAQPLDRGYLRGVTTRVAADIDELAATRLKTQRWIAPADREAIAAAAADVAVLSAAQAAAIERLREQLAR